MLVVNERAAATRSEQCVLDWMRTWTGQYVIVGLAISGCHLPDRNGAGQAREASLVVITPRAVVVIEAEETAPEAATGVLSVQADGRSRLLGFEGDPVHIRDGDSSSLDQVSSHALDLAELVRKRHPDASVDGLVVVVPLRDVTNVEAPEHGNSVVLGSSAGLRAWFHRTANRKLIWTAEQAHALLGELRLSQVITVEDLEAEGFPSQSGRRKRTESRALVGAAHASSPLGASSDTPPVDGSNVAAGQPDSDRLSEPRFVEPVPPRPSDVTEVPVDDHLTSTADNSRALVGAVSLSKHDGPQVVSSAIVGSGTAPGGLRPLSAPPMAPYPPWLEADIARAQSRGAQRSRFAVRANAAPRSHVSALPVEPELAAPELVEPELAAPELVEPEPMAPGPMEPEPMAPADADRAQPARSAPPSSTFTDLWSSWVDSGRPSDDGRSFPATPLPTPTPPQTEPEPVRPAAAQRPNRVSFFRQTEPEPVRPRTPPAAPQRPNRVSFFRRASAAALPRTSTARAKAAELIVQLPQLLPTLLMVAAVIGTVWILVSAGTDQHRSDVQPRPASSTELVAPQQPQAPPRPPEPQCFPFQPGC
ncbi:hypothetical protein [Nocardia nepalensis]|uniref:hypothetical protein n=1 Tax=Nocardia nepalensis TaxID=3375448 RepID=UPI003B66D5B4